jgi:hypothetical protein
MKHTKGPLLVTKEKYGYEVCTEDGDVIISEMSCLNKPNALLFAEAPAMLDLLKEAEDVIRLALIHLEEKHQKKTATFGRLRERRGWINRLINRIEGKEVEYGNDKSG